MLMQVRKIFHILGFHGNNWYPFWFHGDIWVECIICGKRYLPPSEDTLLIPDNEIALESKFQNKGAK